ncbi:MAG: putative Zn-dependent protease [Candidatus Azotimanducaceae bacterium]|jgi:predicted Zn-dependent protease|tara:strand:- start:5061 stop:6488 length:1428 start_codon:yes stop_codon:yes gene_type:complete
MIKHLSASSYANRVLSCLVTLALLSFAAFPAPVHAGVGAEIYNEFVEKGVIYPDDEWQAYVTEIGERLLSVSPHAGRTYTFVVVDQPIVNAWATADGYIFVTRGILAFFNNEDELAAVLGHEIGHVVGAHTKRTVNRGRLGKILGFLGTFATGSSATYGLANTISATALAGYRREHELEADEIGTDLILRAGYDPRALLASIQQLRDHDDFQRSVKNAPTIYHGLLGSHPAHNKRLNELVEQSQHLQLVDLPEPEREYYAMLAGLRFGDESATGVVHEGVYYHGALRLKIAFPEGWNVQATSSEVFGNEPNGEGNMSARRTALPAEPQTPEEYLTKTLRRDDLENGEEIQAGPYAGYLASIKVPGETPKLRKIAVLYKENGVYVFNGELKDKGDPVAFEKLFKDMVMSFRAMSADDLRLINKQSIALVEARPGDTYAKLAAKMSIKVDGEETLRVINGHHPRGEPRAGDLIKVIQ